MAKPKDGTEDITAPRDGLFPQEVVDHLEEHFPDHDPVQLIIKMREALHEQWMMLRRQFAN